MNAWKMNEWTDEWLMDKWLTERMDISMNGQGIMSVRRDSENQKTKKEKKKE